MLISCYKIILPLSIIGLHQPTKGKRLLPILKIALPRFYKPKYQNKNKSLRKKISMRLLKLWVVRKILRMKIPKDKNKKKPIGHRNGSTATQTTASWEECVPVLLLILTLTLSS